MDDGVNMSPPIPTVTLWTVPVTPVAVAGREVVADGTPDVATGADVIGAEVERPGSPAGGADVAAAGSVVAGASGVEMVPVRSDGAPVSPGGGASVTLAGATES